MSRPKADWSRRLAQPIDLGHRRPKLKTLQDVRAHVLALPPQRRDHSVWHIVAGALIEAAGNGQTEKVIEIFRLARMVDRQE